MARIRSIKPEFFSHEQMASKSAHARLLAIGLLTLADCDGRVRWVPMQVHSQVFPWEASVNVEDLLGELIDVSYLVHYAIDGKRYVQITNFRKHQRLTGKEAAYQSLLPEPPEKPSKKRRESQGKQPGVSQVSIQVPIGTEEQGNIGTGEQGNSRESANAVTPASLLLLWNSKMNQKCRLTEKRATSARIRLRDSEWVAVYVEAIEKAVQSDFCNGRSDRGWVADFEWFLKPDSAIKLIEGKYDKQQSKQYAQMEIIGPDYKGDL